MNEIRALAELRPPAPEGDPVEAAALTRARDRLLDRALAQSPPAAAAPATVRRGRRTRRRLVAATAVVVLAAGGLLAVDLLTAGDRPGGASAEAASLLRQAADRTITVSDPVVGPDEYLHVTTVAVYTTGVAGGEEMLVWLDTYTEELFRPGDPAREWVLRRSPREPYRPVDAEIAARSGLPPLAVDDGFTERARDGAFFGTPRPGDWQAPTAEFLAGLPRDPQQLRDRIYRDSAGTGPSPDGEALVYIGDVLRSGIVPADLRAALFRVAATIPGVEVTDRAANLDGRVGVAVGRYEPAGGTREEIIFDPDTGLVIGERSVRVDEGHGPHLPVGSAVGWTAVTTEVVPAAEVDAIPARPRDAG